MCFFYRFLQSHCISNCVASHFIADPEEFITVLFQKVFGTEPLLKLRYENAPGCSVLNVMFYLAAWDWVTQKLFLLRSRRETCQGAYTLQIFLEKEQMGQMPTVQQLLDTSCLSGDIKFDEVRAAPTYMTSWVYQVFLSSHVTIILPFVPQAPHCLIVQMPRFGNKYKMFSHIIPSTELDITDLLYNCEELVQFAPIHILAWEWRTIFNSVFLRCLCITYFSQQLQENASSVDIWPSTSVFSVYQIANYSQEESNNTALPATHR